MTFVYPEINDSNRRCVYKLFFEDGSFYIGSTEDLKRRISGYKSAFKSSIGSVNKLIAEKATHFNTIWFEILEIVPHDIPTRIIEHEFILKNVKDPLILNRSKSAFSNSGLVKSR